MFEVNNDEKRCFSGKLDERGRLRCPMCKGRGYFEPTEQPYNDEEIKNPERNSVKLPALENKGSIRELAKKQEKVRLPGIGNSNSTYDRRGGICQSNSSPAIRERSRTETNSVGKRNSSKPITANTNDSELDNQLMPSPETPKNKQELLKSSLMRLKGSDWNKSVEALKDIVQISRFYPEMLEGSMAVIYRSLITQLKSFRSVNTRTACQAANEIFSNVTYTQRPDFDELINALLQRTADSNNFVRRDANEALDSMVINIYPLHSVRTLVQKGISHRNGVVRAAAARLLVCVVGLVGVRNIFSGNKETRNRIVNAAAQCLQDGSQEVRSYACRIMKMLMEHEDFDEVLQASVNDVLINRIEKALITIKYSKKSPLNYG